MVPIDNREWNLLPESESDRIWTGFISQFHFRPSTKPVDWPSITEPLPSMTWDVSDTFRLYDSDQTSYYEQERRFQQGLIASFRECIPVAQLVYALSWHHDSYSFSPFDPRILTRLDEWPVLAFPIGNYTIFLSSAFDCGVFGHPWERTICTFGEKLMTAIAQHTPQSLKGPIRHKH